LATAKKAFDNKSQLWLKKFQEGDVNLLFIEKVDLKDLAHFRQMVKAYWQELMPKSNVVNDPDQWEAYFQKEFAWNGRNNHPHWATVADERIGFMTFEVVGNQKQAIINNFYIIPDKRRQGYGQVMVQWLFSHFDNLGIEQIDLNVRRDNPAALAFWQAQGFGIAGYRLRQYRDPKSGTAFIGALSSDF
jgi:ribosomal protein S18 acetylase RimI-like enzyme